ncbi:MAG TPA: zf-HC2 domain-containing protein [Thermoanaerobaculia bacterium]|nr:zf-HC2 domain-containing protein [Thermoanaerobaculia bacterium]
MNDDTADLDRLFARLSGEGPHRDPDEHPAPEKLSAYLASKLSPEEDDVIQEHLAHCTLCTELLLDLQRFLEPPVEDLPREGVVDFETAAGWRELRGKLWKDESISKPLRSRRPASLKSLAAVLALAMVGLGMYVLKLHGDLNAPRAGYHILLASAQTRGTAEPVERVKLHEVPRDLSLTLVKPPEVDFPAYVAEISRENSAQVLTIKGLRYQKEEGITLLLSKDRFEPGIYRIVLLGFRDGQLRRADSYRLSILP